MSLGKKVEKEVMKENVAAAGKGKETELHRSKMMIGKLRTVIGMALALVVVGAMSCEGCGEEEPEIKKVVRVKKSVDEKFVVNEEEGEGVVFPVVPPSSVDAEDRDVNIVERDLYVVDSDVDVSITEKEVVLPVYTVRTGDSYVRIARMHVDEYSDESWAELLKTRRRVLPIHFAAVVAYHNERTFNDVLVPGQTLLMPTEAELVRYTLIFPRIWNAVARDYVYQDRVEVEVDEAEVDDAPTINIENIERIEIEEVEIYDDRTSYPPRVPLVYETVVRNSLLNNERNEKVDRLRRELLKEKEELRQLNQRIVVLQGALDDLQENCLFDKDEDGFRDWGVSSHDFSMAGDPQMIKRIYD